MSNFPLSITLPQRNTHQARANPRLLPPGVASTGAPLPGVRDLGSAAGDARAPLAGPYETGLWCCGLSSKLGAQGFRY